MPYSSFVFDPVISRFLEKIQPKTFLDIGAGAGKYGELIKKLDSNVLSTAVELEDDYIKKFNLNSIYDEVWNMSATDLIAPKYYEKTFDVVMVGDVIEHLKKSDGVDLLNFLVYRSRWIILQFPHQYLQNAVDGYEAEAHIAVWADDDLAVFEKTKMWSKDTQRLVMIRGYLENGVSVKAVEDALEKYV